MTQRAARRGPRRARRAHPRGVRARARRRRRRPEDRARPRLLHGLGLRDGARRARAARVDLLGRPLRHARVRRRQHLPGRRPVHRRLPAGVAPASAPASSRATRSVPSAVLVAVSNEDDRDRSDAVAAALRARGIPVEVAPTAAKFGKQIRHADRRGIPFVWFLGEDGRPRRPGQGHPLGRAGRTRTRPPGRPRRTTCGRGSCPRCGTRASCHGLTRRSNTCSTERMRWDAQKLGDATTRRRLPGLALAGLVRSVRTPGVRRRHVPRGDRARAR